MPTTTASKVVTFTTGLFVGLALGTAGGGWIANQPIDTPAGPVVIEGTSVDYLQTMTDLLDPPQEDEPGWDAERHGNGIVGPAWDCATMGDRICQFVPSQATSFEELMLP